MRIAKRSVYSWTNSIALPSLVMTLALLAGPLHAAKVGGLTLDETIPVGSTQTHYNGAGLRKKLFIKLYVGSLYLETASSDASTIIDADEAMAIRLNILSGMLTRDKLLKALKEGFDNATGGNTAPIQPQIDQMIGLMQDKISPGDSLTLAYEPGVGTHVLKNGTELSVIEGLPFKSALFGIWLSSKPAQGSLKSAMLGS
ncbi:chalcone isomerase family protein [Granulosicoccus antarcticus]|uniref:Chalcone isomerase domain-containing protein n=1 Tax=Granulosicoccus antarcticus IMCC3135 TaxID=1192854 RepID=A0A2Z2NXQ0_9GAMM|nr:chalcone isomerase family protein [Granulosicoccus antarcticus]ASJ74751.1 hypothetical protein IMCC3135_23410 [Granulosicoccus antarcticus IMCC3135]